MEGADAPVNSGSNFQLDHKDLNAVQRKRFEHDQITDNRTLREALNDGAIRSVRQEASHGRPENELG